MNDLRELYQEVILEHGRNPRNFRLLENATHNCAGDNPLCGDHIHIYLEVEGEIIKDIAFRGTGCAISQASASIMTSELKGKTLSDAKNLFEKFHNMIIGQDRLGLDEYSKFAAFAGVREFPLRIKCAGLCWHAMMSALKNNLALVSTE